MRVGLGFENQDVVAQYQSLLTQQQELTQQADFMSALLSDVKSTSDKYEQELTAKREKALAEYEATQATVTKLKETLETTTLDLTEQVEQGWASRLAVDDEFAKFCEVRKAYVLGMSLKAKAKMLSSEIVEIQRIFQAQQEDGKRQEIANALSEAEKQFDEIEQTHKVTSELTRKAFNLIKPLNDEAKVINLSRTCQTSKRIEALWARYDNLKRDCPAVTATTRMGKAFEEARNGAKVR